LKPLTYRCLFLNFMLLTPLLFGGFAASANADTPLNFHQVSAELYRSAQPNPTQMQSLQKRGIKTLLNLRQWHSDDSEAQDTNLVLRRVDMNAAVINDEKVVSALREIRFAQKPVLVHCWHGSDRTGLVVAMYRLVFENVSKASALAELRKPEYGYHENFYAGIVRYISSVDVSRIQKRVFSDLPPQH
jgi:tyrosine-protein phosphatase SIW14